MPHLLADCADLRGGLCARLRAAPSESTVPESLPVLFFGDLPSARVVTVGLNPSDQEYVDSRGQVLTGKQQRFATLVSLGARDRQSLTDVQCDVAIATMRSYFAPGKPSYTWFRALSRVLVGFGGDYADGSAAHLDVVQEATHPVWSQLPKVERVALLDRDLPFLDWQIRTFPVRAVLCNGRTVTDLLRKLFAVDVLAHGHLRRLTWWVGRASIGDREVTVAGWNIPLARPTGLDTNGEVELGRLLSVQGATLEGNRYTIGQARRLDGLDRPATEVASPAGDMAMRQILKDQPMTRREFERALSEWAANAQQHDTVGDTAARGQTAWIYVRDDGDLYYLNADSTRAGVVQFLGMLGMAPDLQWTVVANKRGRRNKVAFGTGATVIPGFYFYVVD